MSAKAIAGSAKLTKTKAVSINVPSTIGIGNTLPTRVNLSLDANRALRLAMHPAGNAVARLRFNFCALLGSDLKQTLGYSVFTISAVIAWWRTRPPSVAVELQIGERLRGGIVFGAEEAAPAVANAEAGAGSICIDIDD